jgi:hypothetical protein
MKVLSVTILLCTWGLTLCSARISAQSLTEDVPVPGGTSALSRALGLDPVPEPARFITQLARVIYDPDGTNPDSCPLQQADQLLPDRFRQHVPKLSSKPFRYRSSQDLERRRISAIWIDIAELFRAIIEDRQGSISLLRPRRPRRRDPPILSDHPRCHLLVRARCLGIRRFRGRSRVEADAIVLPGGDAAMPLWGSGRRIGRQA